MPRPLETSPYRLLVEGPDDLHTVIHLLKRHGYDWDDDAQPRPFISCTGGIDELLGAFVVAAKGTYERLGVIVDANGNPATRWQQVRHRAAAAGVDLPVAATVEGTVVPGRKEGSRVGAWMMPDNSSPGCLEDFIATLVPPGDPVWPYAYEAAVEARTRGAPWRDNDRPKAVLYGWLAWQEKPGLPFGTALHSQILRHDSELAVRFVNWFYALYR